MTDEAQAKVDPESLQLRAKPKPVTRVSRRALYTGSAIALLLIAGAILVALDPPDWKTKGRPELLGARRNQTPEGIEKLPSSYDRIPRLGPPNAGDIGKSISRVERDLGITPGANPKLPSYRPDPQADFERAERIRHARMAAQSRESDLFFALRTKRVASMTATQESTSADRQTAPVDPSGLTALLQSSPVNPNTTTASADPNGQQAKLAFLKAGPDEEIYNPHAEQKPASPYQLMAGTIIPASLVTGLNSDLPGTVIAQVTENVFDTVTGQHLLIPQGTRLIGKYDSVIAFGQERALVVWQRLIRPDGSSIVIDNLPATDTSGYSGLTDKVDFHTWKLLKGIALSTLLGVGTELTLGSDESDLIKAIRESTQQNADRAGQTIVERTLNIQPTITVRPGWPLRIIAHKDVVLTPYGRSGE